MRRDRMVWLVIGAVVGLLLGFLLSGGLGLVLRPQTMAWNCFPAPVTFSRFSPRMGDWHMPGMFFGAGWLLMALLWLGPLAGIVALILVLIRRPLQRPPAE